MTHQFHFKNFDPDFKLRFQANLILDRTLDMAPYGAFAVGLVERRDDGNYCCALDIYSQQGPFMASVVGSTPEKALECLEDKMKKQISWWKSHRGNLVPPGIVTGHPASAAS